MANWMGGSCPAMASQVADGYILLSSANLRSFLPSDLTAFRLELEKALRAVRAETPPADDALANAARNRKISRISSALQVVMNQLATR
jgi:hypothetical protein